MKALQSLSIITLAVTLVLGDTLTLEQALTTGLENNFGIRIARIDAKKAENNRILATGGMLPSVTASGNANLINTEYHSDNPMSMREGNTKVASLGGEVGFSWPLFDGFQMFYAYALTHSSSDATQLRSRASIEQAVSGIVRAYFDVYLQEKTIEALRLQSNVSRERLNRLSAQQEMGALSSRELLHFEVRALQDSQAVLDTRTGLIEAHHALAIALGRDPSQTLRTTPSIEPRVLPDDFQTWLEAAQKNNTNLNSAHLRARIEELNVGFARSRFYPQLVANGSLGISTSTTFGIPDIVDTTKTARIGASVQWTLFSGLRNLTNYRNQKLTAESTELSLQETELRIDALVHETWDQYQAALESARFAAVSLDLSNRNFKRTQELFESGAINSLDLRESEQALLQARVNRARAIYRTHVLGTQLEVVAGKLNVE